MNRRQWDHPPSLTTARRWHRVLGGLDTSAALHWMRQKGAIPSHNGESRASPTNRLREIPARSSSTAPEGALSTAARDVAEGIAASQSGAFHISTAGLPYFNKTTLGRAVPGPC